jgi:hypothetical protein
MFQVELCRFNTFPFVYHHIKSRYSLIYIFKAYQWKQKQLNQFHDLLWYVQCIVNKAWFGRLWNPNIFPSDHKTHLWVPWHNKTVFGPIPRWIVSNVKVFSFWHKHIKLNWNEQELKKCDIFHSENCMCCLLSM